MNTSKGQKMVDAQFRTEIVIKKSCISQIIKHSAKAKDAIGTSRKQQNSEIKNLII